jgi:formyl-CoA transferase
MDYDTLRQVNPRLIYCALSGYGETGPLQDKAGYDQVLQAMTGICSLQGPPGEPEIVYGSVVDYYAAALLAGGVSSALYQRERTGQGQLVRISLMRSALAMQSARFVWAGQEGRDVYRDMRSGGITGLHPTRQGNLYISANTPHFWAALCELIGLPQLAADARFDTVRKRAEAADELLPLLRQALAARSALEWEELFGERVPCSAVRDIEDMFDHPQVQAEGMVTTFTHPLVGSYRGFSRAIGFGKGPAPAPRAAPAFAQHAGEVLGRHGYSEAEIAQLREEGVIR